MTRILSAISTGINYSWQTLHCDYYGLSFGERLDAAIYGLPGHIRWCWKHHYDHGCI